MSSPTFGPGPAASAAAAALDAANNSSTGDGNTQTGGTDTGSGLPFGQSQQQTAGPSTGSSSGGGHPAWEEILGAIPTSLHDTVRPTLEKWDKGVNDRFEQVHSRYSGYDQFVSQQVPPEMLAQGLQLIQTLNTNPQQLYEALAQTLGVNNTGAPGGQGQQQTQDLGEFGNDPNAPTFDLERDPRFQQLLQQQQHVERLIQQQQAQDAQRTADVWLDSQLNRINTDFKQRNGFDPDFGYIMGVATGKINAGVDPERALGEAVSQYEGQIQRIRSMPSANAGAPPVIPPGGAAPAGQRFDSAKLSGQDRRRLATDLIQQAMRE